MFEEAMYRCIAVQELRHVEVEGKKGYFHCSNDKLVRSLCPIAWLESVSMLGLPHSDEYESFTLRIL